MWPHDVEPNRAFILNSIVVFFNLPDLICSRLSEVYWNDELDGHLTQGYFAIKNTWSLKIIVLD